MELDNKISSVKELIAQDISLDKVSILFNHFSDGPTSYPKDFKSLDEWLNMYNSLERGKDINKDQILHFFKFLEVNKPLMIERNRETFRSRNRNNLKFEEEFELEYIIYKTLEY